MTAIPGWLLTVSISTDTMAHTVLLTRTTSYYYNQSAPPVTGADLQISDGTAVYILTEDEPGVYRTDPSVYGEAGKDIYAGYQTCSFGRRLY